MFAKWNVKSIQTHARALHLANIWHWKYNKSRENVSRLFKANSCSLSFFHSFNNWTAKNIKEEKKNIISEYWLHHIKTTLSDTSVISLVVHLNAKIFPWSVFVSENIAETCEKKYFFLLFFLQCIKRESQIFEQSNFSINNSQQFKFPCAFFCSIKRLLN